MPLSVRFNESKNDKIMTPGLNQVSVSARCRPPTGHIGRPSAGPDFSRKRTAREPFWAPGTVRREHHENICVAKTDQTL